MYTTEVYYLHINIPNLRVTTNKQQYKIKQINTNFSLFYTKTKNMASIPCPSRSQKQYNLLTSNNVSSQLKSWEATKNLNLQTKQLTVIPANCNDDILQFTYNSPSVCTKQLHTGSLAADSIRSLVQEDEARVLADQWWRLDISHFYGWHGFRQVVRGEWNAAKV